MKELLERQKGITLIALAITIIVLVILAGVSIGMITNDNGVIKEAKNATEESRGASVEEAKELWLIKREGGGKQDLDGILAELEKQGLLTSDEVTEIKNNENNEIKIGSRNISFKVEEEKEENGPISSAESCVGYYADIDGNGTVDGIIYADLAVGGSGTWNGNYKSKYEYVQVAEGLKSYYISNENGTGFGTWEKPVVTAIEGTTGKDRFYVMALEDFNPGEMYTWYAAVMDGGEELDNPVASEFNDFGQGDINTTTMIGEWNSDKYGPKADRDIWGVIQETDNAGKTWDLSKWFIPSKAEWAAFADMTFTEIGVTIYDYDSNYGLSGWYWSSAQRDVDSAYIAYFIRGNINNNNVNYGSAVRLSATF